MIGRIFLKEWKDNLMPFVLGVIFLLAEGGLFLSHENRAALYGIGVYLIFFLPFMAALIGASGFQSEFKDRAWTYVLSLPVRKVVVWMTKFLSQLSIILVLLGLFYILRAAVPASVRAFGALNAPTEFLDLASSAFIFGLPILAFIVAFSLSFLSDKPLVIFVVSLLILSGLTFLVIPRYLRFLDMTYAGDASLPLLVGLSSAGFVLASILTFVRSDLSQRGRTIVRFTSLVAVFLALAFGLQTVIVGRGELFSGHNAISTYDTYTTADGFYFRTTRRGIMKYDARLDQVKPTGALPGWMYPSSGGDDKLAYFDNHYQLGQVVQEALNVIDLASGVITPVARFYGQDSPFKDWRSYSNCLLSAGGDHAAFVAIPKSKIQADTIPVLFWMKADGSDIRRRPLEFKGAGRFELIGWMNDENTVVMLKSEEKAWVKNLIMLNLESGAVQAPESATRIVFRSISPGCETLAYESGENYTQNRLTLLDLKTFAGKEIVKGPDFHVWQTAWNSSGDRLVFNRNSDVCAYSLLDDRVIKVCRVNRIGFLRPFAWVGHGQDQSLAVHDEGLIRVFGTDYRLLRSIPLPRIRGYVQLWGVEDKLVVGSEDGGLWRLDLKTEQWKKLD